MFQMFQWLYPLSWNQNSFKAFISLLPNQGLGFFLITPDPLPKLYPQTYRYYFCPQSIFFSFPAFGLRSCHLFPGATHHSSLVFHGFRSVPLSHDGSSPQQSTSNLHDWPPDLLLIMLCTMWVLFYMFIELLVAYTTKYATLIPEIIWSKDPLLGDPLLGLIILYLSIIATFWGK